MRFAQVGAGSTEYGKVPIEDVVWRVTEIAAFAARVSDPPSMRAAAGDFSVTLAQAPVAPNPLRSAVDNPVL